MSPPAPEIKMALGEASAVGGREEGRGSAHRGASSTAVVLRITVAAALLLVAAAAVIALASSAGEPQGRSFSATGAALRLAPDALAENAVAISKAVVPVGTAVEAPNMPKIALAPVVKTVPAHAAPVDAAAATQASLKAAPVAEKLKTKPAVVEAVTPQAAAVPALVPAVVPAVAKKVFALPAKEAAAAAAAPLPTASITSMVKEIKTLQAKEAQTSQARAAALAKALAHKPGHAAHDDGGERSWREQKSQYERAALKDIEKGQKMDTEKEKHLDLQGQAAKMFEKYHQQAEDLMGTKELHQLNNQSMVAETKRSKQEHDALIALRQANAQLRQVEAAERKEAHARHNQAQAKAVASTQAAIDKSVATELYKPSDFSNLEAQGRQIDMERQSEQVREIGNLLPNIQRQRCTCYALCHILYPVWAAPTSIFQMDSNSTSYKRAGEGTHEGGGGKGRR